MVKKTVQGRKTICTENKLGDHNNDRQFFDFAVAFIK